MTVIRVRGFKIFKDRHGRERKKRTPGQTSGQIIEPDKRSPDWAIPLAYSSAGETFYVPENVFLLGLMNTADRSLAVVDYALRRRLLFFTLDPQFESEKFSSHLTQGFL